MKRLVVLLLFVITFLSIPGCAIFQRNPVRDCALGCRDKFMDHYKGDDEECVCSKPGIPL